jgi:predicted RNase H-like HicB family nuclease
MNNYKFVRKIVTINDANVPIDFAICKEGETLVTYCMDFNVLHTYGNGYRKTLEEIKELIEIRAEEYIDKKERIDNLKSEYLDWLETDEINLNFQESFEKLKEEIWDK